MLKLARSRTHTHTLEARHLLQSVQLLQLKIPQDIVHIPQMDLLRESAALCTASLSAMTTQAGLQAQFGGRGKGGFGGGGAEAISSCQGMPREIWNSLDWKCGPLGLSQARLA